MMLVILFVVPCRNFFRGSLELYCNILRQLGVVSISASTLESLESCLFNLSRQLSFILDLGFSHCPISYILSKFNIFFFVQILNSSESIQVLSFGNLSWIQSFILLLLHYRSLHTHQLGVARSNLRFFHCVCAQ